MTWRYDNPTEPVDAVIVMETTRVPVIGYWRDPSRGWIIAGYPQRRNRVECWYPLEALPPPPKKEW